MDAYLFRSGTSNNAVLHRECFSPGGSHNCSARIEPPSRAPARSSPLPVRRDCEWSEFRAGDPVPVCQVLGCTLFWLAAPSSESICPCCVSTQISPSLWWQHV